MRKRLLSLYPEAWRERYGEEMAALLDETPPSLAATLDLLRGALTAHLRPLAASVPAARARVTIAQVLGCFIVFCAFGSGFAKTTENYDYIEHVHPLLGLSHAVILIGAFAAAGALALAALPLIIVSLAEALRSRDRRLMKLIAVPPVAIGVFAATLGLRALWLHTHHQRAGVGGWLLLGLCVICGAAGAFACWVAPRAIMRRIDVPRGAYAMSLLSLGLVALCMMLVTGGVGAFLIGILADAPSAGAAGNGPGQLINVTASIAIQLAGLLTLSGLAVLSATRGLRTLGAL